MSRLTLLFRTLLFHWRTNLAVALGVVVGTAVIGGALIVEFKIGPPVWVHVVLWGLLTPLLAFFLLRVLKATLIALQYKHKAEEGRLAPD